jgi:hypothetical protein
MLEMLPDKPPKKPPNTLLPLLAFLFVINVFDSALANM